MKRRGWKYQDVIISDEEIETVKGYANFGPRDTRELLAQGVLKHLAGWHNGHTLTQMMQELALIKGGRLTAKGKAFIYQAFYNTDLAVRGIR